MGGWSGEAVCGWLGEWVERWVGLWVALARRAPRPVKQVSATTGTRWCKHRNGSSMLALHPTDGPFCGCVQEEELFPELLKVNCHLRQRRLVGCMVMLMNAGRFPFDGFSGTYLQEGV